MEPTLHIAGLFMTKCLLVIFTISCTQGLAVKFSVTSPLLYFADGRDLRAVDLDSGVIWTVSNVGRYGNRIPPPIGCDWEVPLSNYQFRDGVSNVYRIPYLKNAAQEME